MSNRFSVNTSYVLSRGIAYNGNAAAFRNRPTNLDNIFAKHDFGFVPNDERHRGVSAAWSTHLEFPTAPIVQLSSARPYNATQGR